MHCHCATDSYSSINRFEQWNLVLKEIKHVNIKIRKNNTIEYGEVTNLSNIKKIIERQMKDKMKENKI